MSAFKEPAHHIGAHSAQPNHSQLHRFIIFHNRLFLDLFSCFVRGIIRNGPWPSIVAATP